MSRFDAKKQQWIVHSQIFSSLFDQIIHYTICVCTASSMQDSIELQCACICIQIEEWKSRESEFDKMEIFLCSFCASFSTSLLSDMNFSYPKHGEWGVWGRLCRMFDGRPKRAAEWETDWWRWRPGAWRGMGKRTGRQKFRGWNWNCAERVFRFFMAMKRIFARCAVFTRSYTLFLSSFSVASLKMLCFLSSAAIALYA